MLSTPLEKIESVDMMRILEHGDDVQMVMTDAETLSVDTRDALLQVEGKMAKDKIRLQYS